MSKKRLSRYLVNTFLFMLIFFSFASFAQPPAASSFVRTWETTAPEQDPIALINRNLRDVKQSTIYLDGLSRPIQIVSKKASLSLSGNTDVVTPIVYNNLGLETDKYLAFAATSDDGQYKQNPLTAQSQFFNGSNSPIYGQGETMFYGRTDYEASPLSRVTKSMAPGSSWIGAGRGVEMRHWTNTAVDDVHIWQIGLGQNSTPVSVGKYNSGELYKTVTIDEHGKQVIEFKDKEGKIILKKAQFSDFVDNGSCSGYPDWLCTYYIYDEFNLRMVIQPEGVKLLSTNGWNFINVANLKDEQCFRYEYDQRNRVVIKKIPGAGEVWMVYDTWDRLVLMQDANLRILPAKKWLFT